MTARRLTALALLAATFAVGCDDDETSPTAPVPDVPSEGGVFLDDWAPGVSFEPFADSKADAAQVDPSVAYRGSASLKVTVPGPGDASGFFAGGALLAASSWDLSGYDVLSFWARADRNASLDVVGLGNDVSDDPAYMVETGSLEITGVWKKFYVPIPDPSVLSAEDGLFFFAEGQEAGQGYTIWFDDIRFESLGASVVRAGMTAQTLTLEVGATATVKGLTATVNAGGVDHTVSAKPGYFTFRSSDEDVARVDEDGVITVVGLGTAGITASLGSVDASGTVVVTTGEGIAEPAPALPHDPANVISLYSDAYDDVPVDTWSAVWDMADVEEAEIDGDNMKLYTNLTFAGIEFTSQTVDATDMTHFHMDIWTPDAVEGGETFKIKLVDFGPNGVWNGGGDDVEHELTFTAPTLERRKWVSLHIPLDDFVGMTTRGHVAQLIISGDVNNVYVDNVMFVKDVFTPAAPAPAPTHPAADVVSLFSDAYDDVPVDTWSAVWDVADVAEVALAGGDMVKRYTGLVFAGVEFTSQTVDASEMTHLRFDFWTPDPVGDGRVFKVKLVDFGANGAWDGGGDDVEHEIVLDATSTPALKTGGWVRYDIPLDDFKNLTTRGHLAQLIVSGDPNTVFLDNIYLHR